MTLRHFSGELLLGPSEICFTIYSPTFEIVPGNLRATGRTFCELVTQIPISFLRRAKLGKEHPRHCCVDEIFSLSAVFRKMARRFLQSKSSSPEPIALFECHWRNVDIAPSTFRPFLLLLLLLSSLPLPPPSLGSLLLRRSWAETPARLATLAPTLGRWRASASPWRGRGEAHFSGGHG